MLQPKATQTGEGELEKGRTFLCNNKIAREAVVEIKLITAESLVLRPNSSVRNYTPQLSW